MKRGAVLTLVKMIIKSNKFDTEERKLVLFMKVYGVETTSFYFIPFWKILPLFIYI